MSNEKEKTILKLTREDDVIIEDGITLEELPLYDFEKLVIATNNFDIDNKLGQGGFGPVYKVSKDVSVIVKLILIRSIWFK